MIDHIVISFLSSYKCGLASCSCSLYQPAGMSSLKESTVIVPRDVSRWGTRVRKGSSGAFWDMVVSTFEIIVYDD